MGVGGVQVLQFRRLITKSQKNNSKVMIMQQVLVERIKLPRMKLKMMLNKVENLAAASAKEFLRAVCRKQKRPH